MKPITNNIIITSLFFALLLSATPVLVQADEDSEEQRTPQERMEAAREQAQERQAQMQERMEERQEALQDKREEMEENMAERQANMEERRAEAEAAIQERREEFQAAQEERRAALSERVKERITNLAANVSNRLDAATERMQNIIDRLNSRIEKLNERGLDTSEAEGHMDDAQDAVNAALAQLDDIDQIVSDAVYSEDPRGTWQSAKTEFLAIKENIKSSHASLRLAVSSLKAAAQDMREENASEADTAE